MLVVGLEQHFGGLADTQRYFYQYIYPTLKHVPADYLKKMSSDRIFATQFYPNAFAGCLLLLLPGVVMAVLRAERLMTEGARAFLAGAIGLSALACLYWSRSKGGWLLMLLEGLVVLWWLPEDGGLVRRVGRRAKWIATSILLLAGIAGFVGKYAGFFKKGATSVAARTDYWRAGVQTAISKPVFGTGPGTFSIPYAQLKRPDAEMSRLLHNDFLEQASDSGLPGFIAYSVFVVGGLAWTGRRIWRMRKADNSPVPKTQECNPTASFYEPFAVWVGLLIWNCQGLIEFGLYLPSIAWTAFALMGWLIGRSGISMDTKFGPSYVGR
jgi:O-antigen ligase